MSDFNLAILTVLKHEGEFVDNALDSGGATKFGISLSYLIQQGHNKITVEDIRNLTKEDAIKIYKKDWWDRYTYSAIINQRIATKVFDLSVNMGSKQAHICLQRAIRASTGKQLNEDGMLGEKSFAAINIVNPNVLLAALRSEAAGFYRLLNKPEF